MENIIWVLISTVGFGVSAAVFRVMKSTDASRQLFFCWVLSTLYALLGFFIAYLG